MAMLSATKYGIMVKNVGIFKDEIPSELPNT